MAFFEMGSSGGSLDRSTFRATGNQTTTINLGYKPKFLFLYGRNWYGNAYNIMFVYDETTSSTTYDYCYCVSGGGGKYNSTPLGSSAEGHVLSLTNSGFSLVWANATPIDFICYASK